MSASSFQPLMAAPVPLVIVQLPSKPVPQSDPFLQVAVTVPADDAGGAMARAVATASVAAPRARWPAVRPFLT